MDVLIAHGSAPAREQLARALQEDLADPVEVEDGVAALELLMGEDGPRIALVEWDLPRLDGRELCRILHDFACERRVYLILLASKASGGCIDAGLEAGAHDFLPLPAGREELRARVEYARRVVELPWGRDAAPPASAPAADARHIPGVDDERTIHRRLDEEVERSRRDRAPLSIAVLHFEGLDDLRRRAGREACAAVLAEASRRLRGSLRPYDGLGWAGEDEFLVTMPKADSLDIEAVLDRLRDSLQSGPVAVRGAEFRLTAAIGGATGHDLSAAGLLAAARSALGDALCEAPGCVVPGPRLRLEAVLAVS